MQYGSVCCFALYSCVSVWLDLFCDLWSVNTKRHNHMLYVSWDPNPWHVVDMHKLLNSTNTYKSSCSKIPKRICYDMAQVKYVNYFIRVVHLNDLVLHHSNGRLTWNNSHTSSKPYYNKFVPKNTCTPLIFLFLF